MSFKLYLYHIVCRDGFEFFDKNRCVKYMTSEADKANAATSCKNLGGNVFVSKSMNSQRKLEAYLMKSLLTKNIYLGMSKADGQWIWDDSGTTVFAESMCHFKMDLILLVHFSELIKIQIYV